MVLNCGQNPKLTTGINLENRRRPVSAVHHRQLGIRAVLPGQGQGKQYPRAQGAHIAHRFIRSAVRPANAGILLRHHPRQTSRLNSNEYCVVGSCRTIRTVSASLRLVFL